MTTIEVDFDTMQRHTLGSAVIHDLCELDHGDDAPDRESLAYRNKVFGLASLSGAFDVRSASELHDRIVVGLDDYTFPLAQEALRGYVQCEDPGLFKDIATELLERFERLEIVRNMKKDAMRTYIDSIDGKHP